MRARIAQHLNEIVSLTVMALLCIALIAGQAGASQRGAEAPAAEEPALVIEVDLSLRHNGE